ncbi:uncharacterized protein LOC115588168 [Scomber scombrus]|uniref:Uncharacterized protein LOC115588168 n=1 Tax=Scomber scombrus TaxID=13677 RepID=A0AAV1QES3_SCOSC
MWKYDEDPLDCRERCGEKTFASGGRIELLQPFSGEDKHVTPAGPDSTKWQQRANLSARLRAPAESLDVFAGDLCKLVQEAFAGYGAIAQVPVWARPDSVSQLSRAGGF